MGDEIKKDFCEVDAVGAGVGNTSSSMTQGMLDSTWVSTKFLPSLKISCLEGLILLGLYKIMEWYHMCNSEDGEPSFGRVHVLLLAVHF